MAKSFFEKITRVIDIDEDNRITLQAPTYGQVQIANGKMMKFAIDEKGKQGDAIFDMAQMETELMVACIVAWEGPGFDGRSVTRENILALPSFVIEKLRPSIDEFTKGLSANEKKE